MLLDVVVPVGTPFIAEILRRFLSRRMSGPRLSAICLSSGDEYGHRKWNIKVSCQEAPRWCSWLLDARSSPAHDATIRAKFYHRMGTDWEETFPVKVHDFLWSDNIPATQADIGRILNDGSQLGRAKQIDVTRQHPRVAALVMKEAGTRLPFVLEPEAYRAGLPGRGRLETQLGLEEHRLVVNVRYSDHPEGRFFCFRLTNVGERLEQFSIVPLRPQESRTFLRKVNPEF